MKYAWIREVEGTGNGVVTGLNRKGFDGELTGNTSMQEVIWGMDARYYKVLAEVFTPITQVEKDVIDAADSAEADKQAQLALVDQAFMEAEAPPVSVDIKGTLYEFKAGYESSQMIDSARTLADNLNENDVELWDFYGEPHIFSKSDANDIAIAVGLSFRTNYSAMKHAKKAINDGV